MSSDEATPDEPFGKLMQEYQRAIDDRDFEDATGAVHDMFALAEAERDLEHAYRLLESLVAMDIAAGIHSDLSRW